MVVRRDLKGVHEEAVLRQFESHLNKSQICLAVLNKPDPPDAIVTLDGRNTWVEITDAYLDKDHAIGLTSGASDDMDHIPDSGRLIVEPDDTFSNILHRVIEAKYKKRTMQRIAKVRGAGILLVGIFTPFTTAQKVAYEEAAAVVKIVSKNPVNVFDTIYVYDGAGQRSFHVLYQRKP